MSIELGIYEHYKGKQYEVVGTVLHSETLEELVLYKALYQSDEHPDGQLWVRPMTMFTEQVEFGGAMVPRFKYL